MLRWALVPAAVFALSFAGSLAWFALDDDGGPEPGRAAQAKPAKDGRLVVTYSATARNPDQGFLGTVALDGSDLRNVIEPPGPGRAAANAAPSVAPRGQAAIFQRAVAGPGGPEPPYIYSIPLDGSEPEHRITRGHAAEIDPAWSPDGKRIAFARQMDGAFDLFASAPDGSGLSRLTDTPGVDELGPAWAPDGERLAFARYQEGIEHGPGKLWLARPDGTRARLMLGGGGHDYSAPSWSPDGRRLAFLLDGHLAVVDVGRGALHRLTPDGELKETRPSWSPDGTRIAFTRDPGTILTIAPDGSHQAKVPFDKPANGVAWVPKR
jgi:dipeptidyl aminopeptidase/acylaminoacyl peptidase